MGKRGRKPTIAGNQTISPGQPIKPTDLDAVEGKAWDTVCHDLELQGMLSTTDAALIEVYARTYGLWLRSVKQLSKEDLLADNSGRAFINPLASLSSTLSVKLKMLLSELGLTPRNRKPTEQKQTIDPLEAICGTTPLKLAE